MLHNLSKTSHLASELMNTFTITISLTTYSESPEDWIAESIIDQLEEGEELNSLTIEKAPSM